MEQRLQDGLARLCRVKTAHGTIETPALFPVINPNQILITPNDMRRRFGLSQVITNSYIIYKSEKLREKALSSGVHSVIDFDGPVMTDSGTFQSYVYSDIDVGPDEIVKFQRDIKSDIGTILDIFSRPDETTEKWSSAVDETIRRAKTAQEHKGDMLLAMTVQGGLDSGLRSRCAAELSKLDAGVYPVGGVVPLLESYRFSDIVDIVMASKATLDPSRPVHLFGAGHPMVFGLFTLLGCDLFDTAAYAKYARDDRMMFEWGTASLEDLHELPCHCPVCSSYSSQELRDLPADKRSFEIASHNLHACSSALRRTRTAIANGELWEYVQQTCNANPAMKEAFGRVKHYMKTLEAREPMFRSVGPVVLQTGADGNVPENYHPAFSSMALRAQKAGLVSQAEGANRGDKTINPALEFVYPAAYCQTGSRGAKFYGLRLGSYSTEGMKNLPDEKLLEILKTVGALQFGPKSIPALFAKEINLVRSRKTGRPRNIISNGEHVLSVRNEGYLNIKPAGAIRIIASCPFPEHRVIVEDDTAPFNAKGRNVFAKFVTSCDESIRVGQDVIIVDSKDKLAAVGTAIIAGRDIKYFKEGIAVKVREGTLSGNDE